LDSWLGDRSYGTHGDGGHFTEEPDTMLMFCPPMSSPLTSPGL